MTPEASTAAVREGGAATASGPGARLWIAGLVPLLLLAALLGWVVRSGPADAVRGEGYPPVERLAFQRVVLEPGIIRATILNDGPDTVTIAQVAVDDAFWTFQADGGTVLPHLGRTSITVPYPWVHGEPHVLRVITSTGTTFDHTVAVSVVTPRPDARALGVFALIGIYVGVLPVAIGLLWYPLVRRLGTAGLQFVLALTIGLLVFLLVDAAHDANELAAELPGSLQGPALFFVGVAGAYLALEAFGRWLGARRHEAGSRGWVLALLVAVGIGLHNFGEGLAIGSAFALGQAALGSLLIVGFTLHNTTEGLAIVAPLARESAATGRIPLARLAVLGLIGGVPTILGAWLGGFTYSPVWAVLFLALGVGAILQVTAQILGQMRGGQPLSRYLTRGPVLAGLAAGFAVMFVTGMLVG